MGLYLKAPSQMHWAMTATRYSCHHQVYRALITSSIRTPIPWKGWASGRTPRDLWCSLSLASSTISNRVLSIGIIGASHIAIRPSLIQALHPIIHITGTSRGSNGSSWTSGMSRSPGLCPPLHDSICNSSTTFLHCICSLFYLHCLSSLINWTCQAESHVPCTCIGKPFFVWLLPVSMELSNNPQTPSTWPEYRVV